MAVAGTGRSSPALRVASRCIRQEQAVIDETEHR